MAARASDKYIPLYIVAFFLVIFAVNAVFVYIATNTHTGVVTKNPYEKGLDYNKTIELADKQDMLNIGGDILLDINGNIIFTSPQQFEEVIAYISRPTQSGFDYEIKLFDDGFVYSGKGNFPMKGQWKITVVAKWEDKQYQKSETVVVN